jgi:hypothetical protein
MPPSSSWTRPGGAADTKASGNPEPLRLMSASAFDSEQRDCLFGTPALDDRIARCDKLT